MATDDKEIVSALRAKLADRVGWQRFELWFNGTRMLLGDHALIVEVPSTFFQDWLRRNFRADLEAVCQEILETPATVEFRVNESLGEAMALDAKQGGAAAGGASSQAGGNGASGNAQILPLAASAVNPGGKRASSSAGERQPGGAKGRRYLSFDEFVVGGGNKLAYTSAQLSVERPGEYSPLVLYGPTGCGKTHLLEAIRTAALQQSQRRHAVYLSAEQFTTFFLEALSGKGLPSFRQKYRGVDLLIIDDVQFFAGKRATLVELLYTIDTLLGEKRQLAFALDRAPAEIPELGPELVTRLAGGLVCRLETPDVATRLGIVAELSRRLRIELSAEVQSLVATRISSNARELCGAMRRLQATSISLGKPIDRELAEETLCELTQAARCLRLPDIEQAVCDEFGLQPDSLQSSRKSKAVSHPRMLAMFLARKHTRAALSEIGCFFGGRSHSTVISANKKIESWMSSPRAVSLADRNLSVEDALRRVEQRLRIG